MNVLEGTDPLVGTDPLALKGVSVAGTDPLTSMNMFISFPNVVRVSTSSSLLEIYFYDYEKREYKCKTRRFGKYEYTHILPIFDGKGSFYLIDSCIIKSDCEAKELQNLGYSHILTHFMYVTSKKYDYSLVGVENATGKIVRRHPNGAMIYGDTVPYAIKGIKGLDEDRIVLLSMNDAGDTHVMNVENMTLDFEIPFYVKCVTSSTNTHVNLVVQENETGIPKTYISKLQISDEIILEKLQEIDLIIDSSIGNYAISTYSRKMYKTGCGKSNMSNLGVKGTFPVIFDNFVIGCDSKFYVLNELKDTLEEFQVAIANKKDHSSSYFYTCPSKKDLEPLYNIFGDNVKNIGMDMINVIMRYVVNI